MTATIDAGAPCESSVDCADPAFVVSLTDEGSSHVVHVQGELDIATRGQLFTAVTTGEYATVIVDLAAVTFMDCGGYSCLVASRLVLESTSRSFSIRGTSGQPSRLFALIEGFQSAREPE